MIGLNRSEPAAAPAFACRSSQSRDHGDAGRAIVGCNGLSDQFVLCVQIGMIPDQFAGSVFHIRAFLGLAVRT